MSWKDAEPRRQRFDIIETYREQDPRIPLILRTWDDIKRDGLGTWNAGEVADFANEAMGIALRNVMSIDTIVDKKETVRVVKARSVLELSKALQRGGLLVLRHATQASKATLKRIKMSLPDNMTNQATTDSLIESLAVGIALRRTQERDLLSDTQIITSENARSAGPAVVIAKIVSAPVNIEPALTCINYLPDVQDDVFEKNTKDGSVSWNRKNVDTVAGDKTYDRMKRAMSSLVTKYVKLGKLVVAITHTQQLSEFLRRAGLAEDQFPEYAGLAIIPTEENGIQTILLPTGIF